MGKTFLDKVGASASWGLRKEEKTRCLHLWGGGLEWEGLVFHKRSTKDRKSVLQEVDRCSASLIKTLGKDRIAQLKGLKKKGNAS